MDLAPRAHSSALLTNRVLVNLPLADPAGKGRSQTSHAIVLQVLHTQLRRLGAKGRPDRPTDAPTGPPWRPPSLASPQPTPTAHARPVRPAVAVPLATVTVCTNDVIISPCAQHHAGWPSWTDPAIQELRAERVVHARGASIGYGCLKRRRRHGRTSGLCAPGDGDLAPPWGPAQLLEWRVWLDQTSLCPARM